MLLGMQVIELNPIIKRPPGIPYKAVFDYFFLSLRRWRAAAEEEDR